MGFKKSSAHDGIRLGKLSPAKTADAFVSVSPGAAQRSSPQREARLNRQVVDELDHTFAYKEIPGEVLDGNELDLSTLNLSYVSMLQDVAISAMGELQLPLRGTYNRLSGSLCAISFCDADVFVSDAELGLAGCTRVPDFALLRVFHGWPTLEKLDLSFCGATTDQLLLSLGQHCRKLKQLRLRGCRQVSDAGIVGLVNAGGGDLVLLDLTRFDLQYKLNDISLLSLAEKCRVLQTLILTGCDMLTDVGMSWLCSDCVALVHLDVAACTKLTDLSMRSIGENLLQLQHLNMNYCARVSDIGIRLESLNLTDCDNVSDRAFSGLSPGESHDVGYDSESHRPPTQTNLHLLSLVSLRLKNCQHISDATLKSLSKLSVPLRELDVSGCLRISDIGMLSLTESTTALTLRYLWLRNLVEVTETGISWVAEKCSRLLLLDLTGCSQIKPFSIKSLASCWKFAVYTKNDHFKGMTPRHRAEDWLFIEEYGDCWRAAMRIQCMYRALVARRIARQKREEKLILWVATRMQSVYRGRQARKIAVLRRLQFNKEVEAAKQIQSKFRRREARKEVEKLREARHQQQQAARCIQMAWRRRQLRDRLQRVWRDKQSRTRFECTKLANAARDQEEADAANKLQNLYRARAARHEVNKKRQARREHEIRREQAALGTQAHVRRRHAQKELTARILYAKRINDAARCIQRRWRAKKRWLAYQLVAMSRQRKEEYDAAGKLQATWKRRQGRVEAKLLRLLRDQEQQQMLQAAIKVQTHWRGKRARTQVALAKQAAIEEILIEMKMQYRAASLVQAHFRGRRGREKYREMVLLKKKRWKEVIQPENGQIFYYCWHNVHAGGKRKLDEFRALYDYYEKRVDYGDGEFPSKWPSEIEQDEMDGWGLRVYPRRQPVEANGTWERYVDVNTGKAWFYNKETKASSYVSPLGVFFQSEANARSLASDDPPLENGLNDWSKYYDETQGVDYYYNSKTGTSTFERPLEFFTPRPTPNATTDKPLVSGRDGWEKYVDPQSGYPYYYNRFTMESTFTRSLHFQTARRGDVTMEVGSNDWAKYYDVSQGTYYYYNSRTYESAFVRPLEFATPRVVPQEAATMGMTEFYDPATGKAYFYNTRTAECQLAAVSSSPKARSGVLDYR
ncbi:F-box/lrr-repeat protein 4, partial [Globisporangium splendens]